MALPTFKQYLTGTRRGVGRHHSPRNVRWEPALWIVPAKGFVNQYSSLGIGKIWPQDQYQDSNFTCCIFSWQEHPIVKGCSIAECVTVSNLNVIRAFMICLQRERKIWQGNSEFDKNSTTGQTKQSLPMFQLQCFVSCISSKVGLSGASSLTSLDTNVLPD